MKANEHEINYCADGGWFCSGEDEWPADPSHFHTPGLDRSLGCTCLQCQACGARVRSAAGWVWRSGAADHVAEIYASANWSDSPWAEEYDFQPVKRIYACRCQLWTSSMRRPVRDTSEQDIIPWACSGHPLAELPLMLDGVEVRQGNLDALVARNYEDWAPEGAIPRHHRLFRFWTLRLYCRLFGTPAADVVAQAAMSHLLSPSPAARRAALHFAWTHPSEPAAVALSEIPLASMRLFAGQQAPAGSSVVDLGREFQKTAFKRAPHASPAAQGKLAQLLRALDA